MADEPKPSTFTVKPPMAYPPAAEPAKPAVPEAGERRRALTSFAAEVEETAEVAPRAPAPAAEERALVAVPAPAKLAILTIHGMGEQLPFETLDAVNQALRSAEARARGIPLSALAKPVVQEVEIGGDIYRRVELQVQKPAGGGPREVHLYEAYWAPLTEGKVTLVEVISFLLGAGVNGLSNCIRPFSRVIFGKRVQFPAAWRSLIWLLLTEILLLSLIVLNGTITAVAAARASLGGTAWLTHGLLTSLTAAAGVFCLAGVGFGAALFLSLLGKGLSGIDGRPWKLTRFRQLVLWVLSAKTAAVTIWVAFAMAILLRPVGSWRIAALSDPSFRGRDDLAVAVSAACLLNVLASLAGWAVRRSAGHESAEGRQAAVRTALAVLFYASLAVTLAAGWMAFAILLRQPTPWPALLAPFRWAERGWLLWVWALLAGLAWEVRQLLIQYAGDVAAYVTSYRLDRFDEVRDAIKAVAAKAARAIYTAPPAASGGGGAGVGHEYDRVIFVAHSLGSVVAYDTLNELLNEDAIHGGRLAVAARTKLLLTFGSPLDKTAFLFASQGSRTSETREALAAVVQPLIQTARPFPWVNVYSPNDIISGYLDFYDNPGTAAADCVQNKRDPDATIPLVAHTEYWHNALVWDELYGAI